MATTIVDTIMDFKNEVHSILFAFDRNPEANSNFASELEVIKRDYDRLNVRAIIDERFNRVCDEFEDLLNAALIRINTETVNSIDMALPKIQRVNIGKGAGRGSWRCKIDINE